MLMKPQKELMHDIMFTVKMQKSQDPRVQCEFMLLFDDENRNKR